MREGGSLPAIVDADDDGSYILKFRGAGQGVRALVAEVVSGELARALGLPVPEIVLAELDPDLARTEPDPEIHQLIYDSGGLNLAIDYLPGAVSYDPAVHRMPEDLASRVVWFDAFVSNVDRTARNTNMLMWHRQPWLIDHGATLFFHHSPGWHGEPERARRPFPGIKDHVLLRQAAPVAAVDAGMAAVLTEGMIAGVLAMVPDAWLTADPDALSATEMRGAYNRYLVERLAAPRSFVEEATRVR